MSSDPYQPRSDVTFEEIADRIHFPRHLPRLILMVSPCRSGSTAFLRVFSASGVESHYQPIKAILRNLMQNEEWEYNVPETDVLFVKETLGPYTSAESALDFLRIVTLAGYPAEKIQLIFLVRNPYSTLASWLQLLTYKCDATSLFNSFMFAYERMPKLIADARARGVSAVCHVYEATRDHDPSTVIGALFQTIHVDPTPQTVHRWQFLPHFASPESRIVFPKEPAIYDVPKAHTNAMGATGLHFSARQDAEINEIVPPEWRTAIRDGGLLETYNAVRLECEQALGLQIAEGGAS